MKSLAEAKHILNAAEGWLMLGDWRSAEAELLTLPRKLQVEPAVLELHGRVLMQGKQWERVIEVCDQLVEVAPDEPFGWIHRSYALHELKRTIEAWQRLEPALLKFADNWLIHYNMACYAAQLGQLQYAVDFLTHAKKTGNAKEIEKMAKEDPDLRPISMMLK